MAADRAPSRRTARWAWIAAVLVLLLAGGFVATGVSLVPVSLALGPCLPDLTSPSTYQRRASPLATVRAEVGPARVRVCYGRPAARGRAVFGHLVPWDSLWRTGANEPTRLYTSGPIRLAGIALAPGRYSLYSRPGPETWTVFLSRSTTHWGNDLSAAVRAREVGQATVTPEILPAPVETLTVKVLDLESGQALALEWETTRLALPLEAQ